MAGDIRIRVIPNRERDYRKLARALLALVEQQQAGKPAAPQAPVRRRQSGRSSQSRRAS
jgi:hypothetical protein